jgi:hypothetical protein
MQINTTGRLDHLPLLINQHHLSQSVNNDKYVVVLFSTSVGLQRWLTQSPQRYIENVQELQKGYDEDLKKKIKKQRERAERLYFGDKVDKNSNVGSNLSFQGGSGGGNSGLSTPGSTSGQWAPFSATATGGGVGQRPPSGGSGSGTRANEPFTDYSVAPQSNKERFTFTPDWEKITLKPTPALIASQKNHNQQLQTQLLSPYPPTPLTIGEPDPHPSTPVDDSGINSASAGVSPPQSPAVSPRNETVPSQPRSVFDTAGFKPKAGSYQQNQLQRENASKDLNTPQQQPPTPQKTGFFGKFFGGSSDTSSSSSSSSSSKTGRQGAVAATNNAPTSTTNINNPTISSNNNQNTTQFAEYDGSDSDDDWGTGTSGRDSMGTNTGSSKDKPKREKSGLSTFEKVSGMFTNGMTAAKRYYLNNVTDSKTQRSINIYLGFFIPFFNSQIPPESPNYGESNSNSVPSSSLPPQSSHQHQHHQQPQDRQGQSRSEKKLRRAVHIWEMPPESLFCDMDIKWSLTMTKFLIPFNSFPYLYSCPMQTMEFLTQKQILTPHTFLPMMVLHGLFSPLLLNQLLAHIKKTQPTITRHQHTLYNENLLALDPSAGTQPKTRQPQPPLTISINNKSSNTSSNQSNNSTDPEQSQYSHINQSVGLTPRGSRTNYTHNPLSPTFVATLMPHHNNDQEDIFNLGDNSPALNLNQSRANKTTNNLDDDVFNTSTNPLFLNAIYDNQSVSQQPPKQQQQQQTTTGFDIFDLMNDNSQSQTRPHIVDHSDPPPPPPPPDFNETKRLSAIPPPPPIDGAVSSDEHDVFGSSVAQQQNQEQHQIDMFGPDDEASCEQDSEFAL